MGWDFLPKPVQIPFWQHWDGSRHRNFAPSLVTPVPGAKALPGPSLVTGKESPCPWGHQWHCHTTRQCHIGSSLIPSCRQAGSAEPEFGMGCGFVPWQPMMPHLTVPHGATSHSNAQCPMVLHDAPHGAPHPRDPHSAAPHCRAAPGVCPWQVCLQQGSASHTHPRGLIPSNAPAHHEINSQEGAVITFHLPLHKYVEIKAAHSAEPTNTRQ